MNVAATRQVSPSPTVTESQMPSMPNSIGSTMTAATWNTSVRKNEMSAETSPLLSAVKNAEAYMANPMNKKHRAYSL